MALNFNIEVCFDLNLGEVKQMLGRLYFDTAKEIDNEEIVGCIPDGNVFVCWERLAEPREIYTPNDSLQKLVQSVFWLKFRSENYDEAKQAIYALIKYIANLNNSEFILSFQYEGVYALKKDGYELLWNDFDELARDCK